MLLKEQNVCSKIQSKEDLENLRKCLKRTHMLKDLFDIAFDADLLGRSRILALVSSADLIEKALG
jgi:hypothetical protein